MPVVPLTLPTMLPRRLGFAALVLAAGACSFAWEDYEPAATGGSSQASASSSGASGGSSTSTGTAGGSGTCGSGEKLCDGMCVSNSDPMLGCANASCDPCPNTNGPPSCEGGACAVSMCDPGFADCDSDPATCETSTNTSTQHCGGCNMPCSGSCVNGTCLSENCTNGVDDDGDTMIDCADPDCSAFACIDVPSGWKGPVALYDGPIGTLPVDCTAVPGTTDYSGFNGLDAAAPVCSGCSCGAASVTCPLQALQLDALSGTCTTVSGSVTQQDAVCLATPVAALSAKAAAPTPQTSCPPSGGVPNNPPPTWQIGGLACTPTAQGAGCPATSVCVGGYPSPFGPTTCISKSGDHNCPAGFTDKHLLLDGASDTRGCTACACGAAPGATCSATTTGYAAAGCSGTTVAIPDDGVCHALATAPASVKATVTGSVNSACPASGGTPVGTVAASGETTFCCAP